MQGPDREVMEKVSRVGEGRAIDQAQQRTGSAPRAFPVRGVAAAGHHNGHLPDREIQLETQIVQNFVQ